MLTFYGYDKCDTCRKAKQRLRALGLSFQDLDITEQPPSVRVLRQVLSGGRYSLDDLWNRSGVQYRALDIKTQRQVLSEAAQLELLASNGRLCKRPIVTDGRRCTVGYDAPVFDAIWG